MPKADNLLASTFTSVSATMAGISIAVTSVLLFIFYQVGARGQLDAAKIWLKPIKLGISSSFFFILACVYGFIWLAGKGKGDSRLWNFFMGLGWFSFVFGWILLTSIIWVLYIAIGFTGKVLGI